MIGSGLTSIPIEALPARSAATVAHGFLTPSPVPALRRDTVGRLYV